MWSTGMIPAWMSWFSRYIWEVGTVRNERRIKMEFQRQQSTTVKSHRPLDCWQFIPSNRLLYGFPVQSHFAAAKLAHYSDSARHRKLLLLSGDVHQNLGPATKYPFSAGTRNVTSRGLAIGAIVVLVRFTRSILVFKTHRSTEKIIIDHATLAVTHPLH